MCSLRSTSIKAALGLVALFLSATAVAQINPKQIGWTAGTTGCSTATYVWVPADNACEAPGGGGGGGLAGVNLQTTSYSAVSGDNGKMVYFNLAAPGTLTLPSPPSSTWAVLASDSWSSLAPLTVAWPSGKTLDGYASSCTAQANPGMGGWIFTDGTNYFTRSGALLTFSCVVPRLVQAYQTSCGGGECDVSFPNPVNPGDAMVIEYQHSEGGTQVISDTNGDVFPTPNYLNVAAEFDITQYVVCSAVGGPTTIKNTGTYTVAAVYEVANVAPSGCQDGYNSTGSNSGVSSLSTGSVTTTEPYDFILITGATRTGVGGSTITEGNGYTPLISSGLIASALTYNTFYATKAAAGSVSDTVSYTNTPGGAYAGILALKPASTSTALIQGDLIVAGPNGQLQALHAGAAGEVLTSNGPGAMSSYQPQAPSQSFTWPPSATGPTFSPAAGSYALTVSVTDTCPGSAAPWISAGTTPVAGATGITLTASSTLYGSCNGSGYLTTGEAAYTITSPIRGSNLTQNASATSLTAYPPAGSVAGDFCVLVFGAQNNGLNTPSGWTREEYSGQSYWVGAFYYKVLTSGDISGGVTVTTSGSASPMFIVLVDFVGGTSGYVNSSSSQGTGTTTSQAINQYSNYNTDTVIYTASYRGNTAPTVTTAQPGTLLLQSYGAGTAGAIAVYAQVYPNVASQATTAYFPGSFNPDGYYAGFLVVAP